MIKINEGGLFQIWKRKWWPKSNFCAGDTVPEAKPISLLDVQSAFYVCVIGIFLGLLAFVVEVLIHRYSSYKRTRKLCEQSETANKIVKPDNAKDIPVVIQEEKMHKPVND